MKLEEQTWQGLDELSRETIVVVPLAAVEQHGPHLPLGTDSFIAASIAEALDRACERNLLVLPVQKVGCSAHHMSFPGTLSLKHETFLAAVMESLDSVIHHGFKRLFLLNSHGGNQAIGDVIAEAAAQHWPQVEVLFTSWWRVAADELAQLVEGEFPSVGPACEFETSLMLCLHPELVDMSLARDDGRPPAAAALQTDLFTRRAKATRAFSFDQITQRGVYGRPTLASQEKGQRILSCTVEALRNLLATCWPQAPLKVP